MRHKFAHEGIDTIIGQRWELGSIKFEEDAEYFVTWDNNFSVENIIGKASDIRREDDGTLTAEIDWAETEKAEQSLDLLDKQVFLTVYVNQAVFNRDRDDHGQIVVTSGQLRALFVTMSSGEDPWTEGVWRIPMGGANPFPKTDDE